MKKLCAVILILFFLVWGVYFYDMYSGYSVSKYVTDLVYGDSENEDIAEQSEKVSDNELNSLLYSRLSEEEQDIYDALYNGICSFKSKIYTGVRSLDNSDTVFSVYHIVLYEHPELFWVDGNSTFSSNGYLTVNYIYDSNTAREKKALIEQKASEIVASVSGESEYEISLSLFDYIISNTQYDYENVDDMDNYPQLSTIEGVLLDGKAICGGYSRAYQYLLKCAGLASLYISGTANIDGVEESHAWVCQEINGEYYFSDPTWCDAFEKSTKNTFISHTYFCLTGEEMARTHTVNELFGEISATSKDANYFVKEHLYFSEYDAMNIRGAIINEIQENTVGIEFKFSTADAYNDAVASLIDKAEIYTILQTVDLFSINISSYSITYVTDDVNYVLTIIYEN